ncbi:uncharacterized protein EDB91DRAFT_1256037 [Suillus paluster]|uniref:uncharacterized protein n=1 Tax=Suillus paluster TaxID=48578 RepID=UPI001B882F1D|nr:uncharacterized protein EDB91DRAFT_1256037 [Suillus paluster]KAG1722501.1 hypothetical protein EDB91DRAFT_1256037 [Suillus paluster]
MTELSDNELEKVKDTAEEWSNNFTSKIQAHSGSQCGMRVFVMSVWKNEQGEVLFGMHDDNEALGDGDSFMKMKEWEDIEPVWQEYAQEQFGARARDGGKYVPVDVDLKEPSKLQHWDMTALLNFWYARQEKSKGPTFLFKASKNRDGDMVTSVVSGNSPSHQTHKVRRDMIQRPWNSETETDSDPETDHKGDPKSKPKGDTHDMEDDAGDDAAEGRSPQKRPRTEPGPSTAHEGTAVPHAIPKPCPVNAEKTGALLTSRMGNLPAGLTERVTGNVQEDGAIEGVNRSPALKNMRGKKAVIESSARTTQSKSTQQPLDTSPRVTRARGKK